MRKPMFLRRPGVLRIIPIAISVAIPLAAGDLSSQIARVSETKTLDAAPSGTLHFENSRGAVNIEGWDQPRVEITVIKSTTGLFHASDPGQREAATHVLEHAQIKSDRNGDEIRIITQIPRHDRGELNILYSIKAPRDSKIVIDHGNGGVYIAGMAGDIDATLKQGQLTLVLPEDADFSIDARATFGEVYWEGDGQGKRHHFIGHSFTGGPSAAAQPQSGQTVPITVTTSVDGVDRAPRQINVPVVHPDQHKLHLNVCYGDITIAKAYTIHAS
jgi:hypothetical protein